jgi:Ca2+/Na+ antiporter
LFLGFVYTLFVLAGSSLISDGAELLLLIPRIAPVVGSVVLPVLGAVPDGAMVLFSGLGPIATVQSQISVGVGALAGSTVMLLTLPWFLSVLGGRVSVANGHATYAAHPKLDPEDKYLETGVQPMKRSMRVASWAMVLTSIPYFIIQGAAFGYQKDSGGKLAQEEQGFAKAGFALCVVSFFLYMYMHLRGERSNEVLKDAVDEKKSEAILNGTLSLEAAFYEVFDGKARSREEQEDQKIRLRLILKKFFIKYDTNKNGLIDDMELRYVLKDLGLSTEPDDVAEFLRKMDADQSGDVTFEEFYVVLEELLRTRTLRSMPSYVRASRAPSRVPSRAAGRATSLAANAALVAEDAADSAPAPLPSASSGHASNRSPTGGAPRSGRSYAVSLTRSMRLALAEEAPGDQETLAEEDEDEPIPTDLAHLSPAQQKIILRRAGLRIFVGTFVVLLFSDPLVDMLGQLAGVMGISPFYVGFVVAPLASNATEIIAAYAFARKKTSKTISISLTTLLGAAVLNNTFTLGIFLALVSFRQLQWTFSAETLAILLVELTMFFVSLRRVQTVAMAYGVLSLFPLSIVFVWVLEQVVGWG